MASKRKGTKIVVVVNNSDKKKPRNMRLLEILERQVWQLAVLGLGIICFTAGYIFRALESM